jgi:hypothetical protein
VTIAIPRLAAGPAIGFGVTLALFLAAVVATGGLQVERTTNVLIGFMLAAAALCATALVRRPARPLHGGLTLLAFGALAALTAASITWSLSPSDSAFETARTCSPPRWPWRAWRRRAGPAWSPAWAGAAWSSRSGRC